MDRVDELKKELRAVGTAEKAKASAWFFKTGKGQYGEGDVFIGVTVPEQRKTAKKYIDLSLNDTERLLRSKEYEFRLTALIILVKKFKDTDDSEKKEIYELYLRNTKWVNNWDLVDSSAQYIVGPYLENKNKSVLIEMTKSDSVWERRIAILAGFHFIKKHELEFPLKIASLLLKDEHDLIHKAVGWMLREIGKVSKGSEENFLNEHVLLMPRTMLRYAIEKFNEKERKYYLNLGK